MRYTLFINTVMLRMKALPLLFSELIEKNTLLSHAGEQPVS